MSDSESTSRTSPSASSSASASPSPAAPDWDSLARDLRALADWMLETRAKVDALLDDADIRRLAEALDGMRQGVNSSTHMASTAIRQGAFREQMTADALKKNTAVLEALPARMERAARLNREVARAGQQALEGAAGKLEQATGEFKTQAATEGVEITKERIRVRGSITWRAIGAWALRSAPWLIKGAALVGSGIAAAWAWFKYHAHNLLD